MKRLLIVIGGLMLSSCLLLTKPAHAETTCANITTNSAVDSACCVDQTTNTYTNAEGVATHDAYLACVAKQVVKLKLSGAITDREGSSLIIGHAENSSVNK